MSEAYDLPAGRARAASLRDLAAIQRDGDNLTAAARALDEALDEITRLRAEQVGTPHPPALRPCDAHLVDRIRRAVTGPYAGPAAGLAAYISALLDPPQPAGETPAPLLAEVGAS